MSLSGLHILLTYKCNRACDHCFVWGSPEQSGTWTWKELQRLLHQARDIPTMEMVYFEGGEPFLYYPLLKRGVEESARLGFKTGIVTNAYWALSPGDAELWLEPLADLLHGVSISSDHYHGNQKISDHARYALAACEALDISAGLITIAQPEDMKAGAGQGALPEDLSEVRYRGRAAHKLADQAPSTHPGHTFTTCPYEDLRSPSRIHIDPLGYLHLCQGISMGNINDAPLSDLIAGYQPRAHPIIHSLLTGGPAELVRAFNLPIQGSYADACHLCDLARHQLRERFPRLLGPDQMYGEGV